MLGCGIHRNAGIAQQLKCCGLVVLVRLEARVAGCDVELLLLKIGEPEGVILPEWSAQRSAPLNVRERQIAKCIEWVAHRKRLVAFVVIGRTMEGVCAGFGNQVDTSTWIPSHFRRRLSLKAELSNRVNRKRDAGDVFDAALVDRGDVVPPVVIVGAIDLPVDLVSARTIH